MLNELFTHRNEALASKDSKLDILEPNFMRQVKFWISRTKTNLGHKQLKHSNIEKYMIKLLIKLHFLEKDN